ncbi:MAG: methyltransferase family protein [Pseudobacter sp.]|uniref:methyltransferase family protein n=1 Tax=Pseudobacter sp. TaxID=2045420 RepID=UPI003F7F77A9
MMQTWLIIFWIVFGLLHSLLAAEPVKAFFSRLMGKQFRYYRLYYSILNFLILGAILLFQFSYRDLPLFSLPVFVKIMVLLPLIGSLLIMGICIRKYFFHLSGIDVLFPQKLSGQQLETGGLNRFVRHPLYTGTILLVWCLFLLFPTSLNGITAFMITLYTCIGTLFEEKKLRRIFGEAYIIYQQRVPMLIPFI